MTKRGKEFFSYDANVNEILKGINVEEDKFWTAGVNISVHKIGLFGE